MIPTVMAALAGASALPLKVVVTTTSAVAVPAAATTVDIFTVDAGLDGQADQPAQGAGYGGTGGTCNFVFGYPCPSAHLSVLYCIIGTSSNPSTGLFVDSRYFNPFALGSFSSYGGGGGGIPGRGSPIGGGGGACGTERGGGGGGDYFGNGGLPFTAGSLLTPYVGPGGASASSGVGWGAGGGGGNATGNLAGGTGNNGGILLIFR